MQHGKCLRQGSTRRQLRAGEIPAQGAQQVYFFDTSLFRGPGQRTFETGQRSADGATDELRRGRVAVRPQVHVNRSPAAPYAFRYQVVVEEGALARAPGRGQEHASAVIDQRLACQVLGQSVGQLITAQERANSSHVIILNYLAYYNL